MANFAALQARVNASVLARLGNAVEATVAGVVVPYAIFSNGYATGNVGMLGMATSQPALTLATTLVPAHPVGQAVVVAGQGYSVAAHEPDGTGISRLVLEVST